MRERYIIAPAPIAAASSAKTTIATIQPVADGSSSSSTIGGATVGTGVGVSVGTVVGVLVGTDVAVLVGVGVCVGSGCRRRHPCAGRLRSRCRRVSGHRCIGWHRRGCIGRRRHWRRCISGYRRIGWHRCICSCRHWRRRICRRRRHGWRENHGRRWLRRFRRVGRCRR